jgi:large subunit ribosomal protein L19
MNQKMIAFNLKQRKSPSGYEPKIGDVIKVFRKIKEGSKERLQSFQGTIIAIKGGQSSSKIITVRKISFGVGVELILPLSSPQIQKVEFVKHTRARRAKLYFVRDKSVKVLSKKLKEVTVKTAPIALQELPEETGEETSEVVAKE